MRKTYVTRFPSMKQRLRLASHSGGFILIDGNLMQIDSIEELGDQMIADLIPATFLSDVGLRQAA